MKIVMFYHSLVSDWNHGNAHFLRGTVTELLSRGHKVAVYEPENSWSRQHLIKDHGEQYLQEFEEYYPHLRSNLYDASTLDLEEILADADLVIVHEWNDPELVKSIGEYRAKHDHFLLLFHDTHHRAVTNPKAMAAYDLEPYDGVLAFGEVIRDIYLQNDWAKKAWTWHEAADVRVFTPVLGQPEEGDLVWVGNWGDDERTKELHEFLIEPVQELGLKAAIYGVRYPEEAIKALEAAGIEYRGYLPNFKVPEVFGRYKLTVHVPRGPYVKSLPGIPTIRPFEAMACGIPLISAPWNDAEGLFTQSEDFLFAKNKKQMIGHMERLLTDTAMADEQAATGLQTVRGGHTCAHRVSELLKICATEFGIKIQLEAEAEEVLPAE